MTKQDPSGGTIVNTSSVNGLGGAPGAALYSTSKAGMLAPTKSAGTGVCSGGHTSERLWSLEHLNQLPQHLGPRAQRGIWGRSQPQRVASISLPSSCCEGGS